MKNDILQVIFGVVDLTNRDKAADEKLEKSPSTVLYGSSSSLDSLELINFIVAVEEGIQKKFGKAIVLADDRALSQDPVPFSSVSVLASYIEMLLNEKING